MSKGMKDTGWYFRDKAALVTGASSGIGQELAWQLGQSGAKLTIAARRRSLLETLAERIAATGPPAPLVANSAVPRAADVTRSLARPLRHCGNPHRIIPPAAFSP